MTSTGRRGGTRPGAMLLLALLALLAAACGGSSATPSPTPSDGKTAFERALSDVAPDGSFTKDQALTLFALAFGPLPGVDVQRDPAGVADKTTAIGAVMRFHDELTAEQLAAIKAYMAPPPNAIEIVIPPVSEASDMRLIADVSDDAYHAIEDAANGFRAQYAERLGFDMEGRITLLIGTSPEPENGGWAYAFRDDGSLMDCTVTIQSESIDGGSEYLAFVIAHEIFHCFQFSGFGDRDSYALSPAWVVEGQASWAGAMLTGWFEPEYWGAYLADPQTALVTRTYDAIGFFSHLTDMGVDPWTTMPAMWQAGGSNALLFEAAGANTRQFLTTWASSLIRDAGRGAAWDTDGPDITDARYKPATIGLTDGTSVDLGAPAFTNEAFILGIGADMLHVRYEDHARLSDGTFETTALDDVWFCVKGHDCEKPCPESPDLPPIAGTIGSDAIIAFSGGIDGGVGTAAALDIPDDECETPSPQTPRPSSTPDRSCNSGCGQSFGDVHIEPVDGQTYDFQAVGEFVLAKASDGAWEIQTRQGPYGDSTTVSINTAVALRVGDHRVAVYADQGQDGLRATIDGAPVPSGTGNAPIDVGGGVTVTPEDDIAYHVDFGGGGYLGVVGLPGYGVNVIVRPPAGSAAGMTGLMGSQARGSTLPALADGSIVGDGLSREEFFAALYGPFADGWRVTQQGSIFDYAPGTSTETFTDRSLPARSELRLLDELTPAERARGEAACADVLDAGVHTMCVYDAGITGDAGFADPYESTVAVLDAGSVTPGGELLRIVNLYEGEAGPVGLDVYAWSSVQGQGSATKVMTVPFGEAGEWFDPGRTDEQGIIPESYISIQRAGEKLNGINLNLIDLHRSLDSGAERTLLVYGAADDEFTIAGGRAAGTVELYETDPRGFGLETPTPGAALVFPSLTAAEPTTPDISAYIGAGDGCLTYPDFPTVPQRIEPFAQPAGLALPLGRRELTVQDGARLDVPPACRTTSLVPPVPVDAKAGDRFHLFVYPSPGTRTLTSLLLPFGR